MILKNHINLVNLFVTHCNLFRDQHDEIYYFFVLFGNEKKIVSLHFNVQFRSSSNTIHIPFINNTTSQIKVIDLQCHGT